MLKGMKVNTLGKMESRKAMGENQEVVLMEVPNLLMYWSIALENQGVGALVLNGPQAKA